MEYSGVPVITKCQRCACNTCIYGINGYKALFCPNGNNCKTCLNQDQSVSPYHDPKYGFVKQGECKQHQSTIHTEV